MYKRIHVLLLTAYIASLLFGTFTVYTETTLSFVLGGAWLISKLWGILYHDKVVTLESEGIFLAVLFLYLVGVDTFVHGGLVIIPYYISFGLNGVIFLLLADEFSKDALLREKMIRVFSATTLLVALLYSLGLFTTQSAQGRFTFMQQNENELSVNFLIAFVVTALAFAKSPPNRLPSLIFLYTSAFLFLHSIINTGTRFALCATAAALLLLVVDAFRTRDRRHVFLFVFSCLLFSIINIMSFSPVLERLSPTVPGNTITNLGGRVSLWHYAFDALIQSPINGWGYDGLQRFVMDHTKNFGSPHNFVLEVGALGGGLALIIVGAFYYCVLLRIYRHWIQCNRWDMLICSIPLFVTSMMLNITTLKPFWFFTAYFITATSLGQKKIAIGAKDRHVS